MNESAPERLYLLDAHGLIFQMFHAIPGMTAPDGRPTNAVFGVARDLLYLTDEVRPEYLLCAFDTPEPTFRTALYPDYKAHRPPPPDDLRPQVPMIRQVLEAMNVPVLALPGFEADDVIATVALGGAERGLDVYICSSDKDCRQLLGDRVRMLNLRKKQTLDRAGLLADWGVAPEQVVDYQALVGDKVDNVPGVEGVGEKTAAKLLQQYGSVDNLLLHLDEVRPPRIQANLRAAAESNRLALSRELVRLKTDVPLGWDWDNWRRRDWDGPRLAELFQEFGFRSLAARVRETLRAAGAARNAAVLAVGATPPAPAGDLFAGLDGEPANDGGADDFPFGANAPAESNWETNYRLVDTPKKWESFLTRLRGRKRFAFDLETTALDPFDAEVVGYAFCWKEGDAYYVPVRGPEGEKRLDPGEVLAALKPLFEDAAVEKVNQNIKYEMLVLRRHGVALAGVAGDPMVAHYLLHAGERSHNLDDMTRDLLKHENIPIADLIGKGKKQVRMDQVPVGRVKDYACEDADAAWRLAGVLEGELSASGLLGLYKELEVPLIDVLAELEQVGVRLDVPFLGRLSEEMARQLQDMEKEIHALAGKPFNIASPKQLRQVLFEEMKLPPQKRTDLTGEASTDQETLERLAALGHELPRKIIEYRQVQKLKGTYVDALPALVHPKTGRVHASFNQTVTATGRLSASNPNLQNIPTRTEMGKQVRQAFLPAEGWTLLTADYSQVELRMLAHYCGDEGLRAAFAEDRDIHASVAAEIFRVPEAEVTPAQRRVAKTVNFGVVYGISPHGLAVRLGIPRDEAARFIDAYFARYPKVLDYQDRLLAGVRENGYVSTILGRRRNFDRNAVRANSTYQQRNQAEREAINMEIQGSAADLIKRAMLAVHRRLRREGRAARMLLSVHDELVFEVPPAELTEVARLVRDEMAGAMGLTVPLKVDVAAGPNWLDVSDLPLAG